jgi:hypothetical protein
VWFDASSSKDPPMVSVTSLSGVLLSHPEGALPRSPRKVTGGNGGNAAKAFSY